MRVLPPADLPGAEQIASCPDCRGPMEMDIDHRLGMARERCPRCGSPWRSTPRIPAAVLPRETPPVARHARSPRGIEAEMSRQAVLAFLAADERGAVTIVEVAKRMGLPRHIVVNHMRTLITHARARRRQIALEVPHGAGATRTAKAYVYWRAA